MKSKVTSFTMKIQESFKEDVQKFAEEKNMTMSALIKYLLRREMDRENYIAKGGF